MPGSASMITMRWTRTRLSAPHPRIGNFYFANGFSGHGLQQGPAAGNAIAELIIHGVYQTIDLTRLGYDRVARNEPLFEKNVI